VGTLAAENNEEAAKMILEKFLDANEAQLENMKYRKDLLYDIIAEGLDEEEYLATFKKLMSILGGKLT